MRWELYLLLTIFLLVPLSQAINNDTNLEDNLLKNNGSDIGKKLTEVVNQTNPWNEEITISPVWQNIIGTFFGLNLHNESTEISVKETIVLFMAFIMFFVLILGILKMTPLFTKKIVGISTNFIASIIITLIVSITGAFINLKDVLIKGVEFTVGSFGFLDFMLERQVWGIIITMFIIIPIIFIIYQVLDIADALIKKYSQISRSEIAGRKLKDVIDSAE